MTDPRRFALVLVLTLSAAGLALLGGPLAPARAADPPAGEDGVSFRAADAKLSGIWWNRPQHVEALGLTAEQREAMDALLVEHLERRRTLARKLQEARRSLGDRLAAGDWEGAEELADAIEEHHGALARGQSDLALAVVRLLEPAQRETLDEEFPLLLRRPWVAGGLGLRRGAGRFRGRGPGAPGRR